MVDEHPNLEAELGRAVVESNLAAGGEVVPATDLEFVALAEKCGEALVQAATIVLNEAQSNLEQAKLQAKQLVDDARRRGAEIKSLTSRIQKYGRSVITAHETFHNGNGHGNGAGDH